jgi:uncharacterized SAM-binding protein YcdF (DUF218 family)
MFESLIRFLLDPFNVLWLLLLATAGVWFLKKKRFFKWLAVFTAGWFLIVSTPLVPVVIINSLEDHYEPLYIEELEDINLEFHIIVLGAGHGFDDRLPPNSLLSQNALGRLNEGIRLQQQLPNSKLVLSGSTSTPGRTTQAEMLQKTALLLGIEEENTIVQKEPMNTWQEAEVYASDYGNTHSVILVTSATHMPRAMMSFNKFGLEPTPSPTNYRLLGSWKQKRFGLPSRHSMDLFNVGMSSYAAMLYYQFFK